MQEYKDRNFYGLWDGDNSPDIVDMAFAAVLITNPIYFPVLRNQNINVFKEM